MDNYLLNNYRKAVHDNQDPRIVDRQNLRDKQYSPWRTAHRNPKRQWRVRPITPYQRWVESFSPESLNMFLGLHGPNRIPKAKEYVQFRVQPYLEAVSRSDPSAPPKVLSLGKNSTMDIIGLIDFKQLVDKKRNLYKAVVFVIQNDAGYLQITAPEGYENKLPFYKQRIFCPLAGAKFHMYYAVPKPQGVCNGIISKIYIEGNKLREQYIPLAFQI